MKKAALSHDLVRDVQRERLPSVPISCMATGSSSDLSPAHAFSHTRSGPVTDKLPISGWVLPVIIQLAY